MNQRQLLLQAALDDRGSQTAFEEAIAKSFLISADQAHAVHPNYAYGRSAHNPYWRSRLTANTNLIRVRSCRPRRTKHEDNHRPKMNLGVVIKHNANQRYSTTAATAAVLRAIADRAGVVLQVLSTSPCPLAEGKETDLSCVPMLPSPGHRTLWSGTTRPAAAPSAPFCQAASACARLVMQAKFLLPTPHSEGRDLNTCFVPCVI